jgi:hypothetical protein
VVVHIRFPRCAAPGGFFARSIQSFFHRPAAAPHIAGEYSDGGFLRTLAFALYLCTLSAHQSDLAFLTHPQGANHLSCCWDMGQGCKPAREGLILAPPLRSALLASQRCFRRGFAGPETRLTGDQCDPSGVLVHTVQTSNRAFSPT